jgi:hypothetical protein
MGCGASDDHGPIGISDVVDGDVSDSGNSPEDTAPLLDLPTASDQGLDNGVSQDIAADTNEEFDVGFPDGFLDPCETNSDCTSGFCIPVEGFDSAFVCTVTCFDQCPLDWGCRGVAGSSPDVIFICVPLIETVCNPCLEHLDCNVAGDLCVELPEGSFCGQDCSLGEECPEGYSCSEVLDEDDEFMGQQCLPDNGSCLCGPETDFLGDPENCGICGQVCSFINAEALCVEGACAMGACLEGFIDLDGDPENGCEYTCTPVSEEDYPDIGLIDADCDGIDGELDTAVFVSTGGFDEANLLGTHEQPFATIAAAMDFAQGAERDVILIASGTYEEQVQIRAGLGLYGGYNAEGWTRDLDQNVSIIRASQTDGFGDIITMTADAITADTVVQGLRVESGSNASQSGATIALYVQNSGTGLLFEAVNFVSGDAGNGSDGVDGQKGSDGLNGAGGTAVNDSDCGIDGLEFDQYGGVGGAGGVRECGAFSASGGAGGNSGHDDNCAQSGGAAANTFAPDYGAGGGAGCDENAGGDGQAGQPGPLGVEGDAGNGYGSINQAGRWVPSHGDDGTDGDNGSGGGGGGGGGGYDSGFFECSWWGGGGGGGASGGCMGTAGTSGKGGGASISALIFNASPSFAAVTFMHGSGGNGGRGGTGGAGGEAGAGGLGADNDKGKKGGNGGHGGPGGAGGHGGGGGGGPGIGLFVFGTSTPQCTEVIYGSNGSGGTGGPSSGQPGANGHTAENHGGPAECGP